MSRLLHFIFRNIFFLGTRRSFGARFKFYFRRRFDSFSSHASAVALSYVVRDMAASRENWCTLTPRWAKTLNQMNIGIGKLHYCWWPICRWPEKNPLIVSSISCIGAPPSTLKFTFLRKLEWDSKLFSSVTIAKSPENLTPNGWFQPNRKSQLYE